eukprot:gene10521-19246_t
MSRRQRNLGSRTMQSLEQTMKPLFDRQEALVDRLTYGTLGDRQMENSKALKIDRATELSTNLPTISESFQEEKHFPLQWQGLLTRRRFSNDKHFHRTSISLPPIFAGGTEDNTHDRLTSQTKRRPSTPRPVPSVREGIPLNSPKASLDRTNDGDLGDQKCFSKGDTVHLRTSKLVPQEDIRAESEEFDNCFPLFSVSPVSLHKSPQDDFLPQSRIFRRRSTGESRNSNISLNRAKMEPRDVHTDAKVAFRLIRPKQE